MTSARIASSTMMSTTARPISAPRFSMNASQNARSSRGGAPAVPATAASAGSCASATMADARIDDAVKHVDDQVDENDERGDQHHAALQGRIVASRDALDQPFSDAGPGEDGLGEHRARDERAYRKADHGHDRNHRVAQRVQADHAPRGQA